MPGFFNKTRKIIFLIMAIVYLSIGFIFLSQNGHMHNQNVVSKNCYYVLGAQSFCQMNIFEYLNLWKELTLVPLSDFVKIILSTPLLLLAYLSLPIFVIFLFGKWKLKNFPTFNFLLIRQIINPRAP